MGWFFVNILLPAILPIAFLSLLKLVTLPPRMRERANVIRAVQDGQLGWVSMGFAASCTYELLEWVSGNKSAAAPAWVGFAFAVSSGSLAFSGFIAMLGTLFPVDDNVPTPKTRADWAAKYRLFLGSVVATLSTAVMFTAVHFSLPG